MRLALRRRQFLVGAGAAFVAAPFSSALAEIDISGARSLSFNNLHTGEKLDIDYWVDGGYVSDALQAINHILRDYRNDEIHVIEPKLLDLLATLRARLDTSNPLEVISGYRSPTTNAMLHAEHSGVAAKSLHMQGMAIDIRVAGRSLDVLHNAALAMSAGGVGFYPKDNFVHVDIGRVRRW